MPYQPSKSSMKGGHNFIAKARLEISHEWKKIDNHKVFSSLNAMSSFRNNGCILKKRILKNVYT